MPDEPVPPPRRTAVLISGRGTNLESLLNEKRAGKLPATEFILVLSNNPGAKGLDIAREHGVPAIAIDHRGFRKDREGHERAILSVLQDHDVEFVVLAGYMRVLTPVLVGAYEGRMLNIHPSLLPAFPGVRGQEQALEYGVRVSGCTVHFVTEEMDGGPVIVQRTVPVLAGDDPDRLAARILREEHKALPLALDLLTRGRLRIRGRHVEILRGNSSYPLLERELPVSLPLLIATGNAHKAEEIGAMLAGLPLSIYTTEQIDTPGPGEVREDAPDYEGNARLKAIAWQEATGKWTLADDSGLEVDALDGRPGVQSSRYAATTEERNRKLLGELRDVPEEKRTARFVCSVVLRGPRGEEHTARGVLEGRIAFEPSGDGGFGYDPVFLPDGYGGESLASLGPEIKNRISHRARAIEATRPALERISAW